MVKNRLTIALMARGTQCILAAAGIGLLLSLGGCAQTDEAPRVTVQAPPPIRKIPTANLQRFYVKTLVSQGVRVIKQGETIRMVFPSDQLFNHNSANIDPGYFPVLKVAARLMKTYDKVSVQVAAYSDNVKQAKAPQARKLALTKEQAAVVEKYLWSQGANARLIYALGLSKKNAVAWNGQAEGRVANRRVEVTFRYYPKFKNYN